VGPFGPATLSVPSCILASMTTPDEVAAGLTAAVQICDETGGGADYQAVAARIGADPEIVKMKLLPAIARYFGDALPGDDGIVVVREPTAEARQFAGS
jgi:hypothetical protein